MLDKISWIIITLIIILIIILVVVIIVECTKQNNSNQTDDSNKTEGFFSTGLSKPSVNALDVVEGSQLFTDGQLNNGLKYSQIVKDVKDGKGISDNIPTGVVRGDSFDEAYNNQKMIQSVYDKSPSSVKKIDDIDKISKNINSNSNGAKNNMISRGGLLTKIKLDPNGTVGVMEDNAIAVPERERNRTIYSTNHVIGMPSFQVDYTKPYTGNDDMRSGFSKAMSVNVKDVVSGIGANASRDAQVINVPTNNTFSQSY